MNLYEPRGFSLEGSYSKHPQGKRFFGLKDSCILYIRIYTYIYIEHQSAAGLQKSIIVWRNLFTVGMIRMFWFSGHIVKWPAQTSTQTSFWWATLTYF